MKRTMLPKTRLIFNFICCCILALLPLSSCEEEPSITFISKEQTKEIGQDVEFNCTVQNIKDYSILWIKLDKFHQNPSALSTYNGITTTPILRDKRFEMKFNNQTSTYSLKITDLQESDTGFYECQIFMAVEEKKTAEVQLQIKRHPTISNYNTTAGVNVTEGAPFQLYCLADGFPVPRVSWKRENDLLLSTGGVIHSDKFLEIKKSHRNDRGVYICVAENGVGPQAQKNVTVNIQFAPVITAVRPRVGQALDYDANLECKVEAYPAPKVTWYRNGKEIDSHVYEDNTKDEFVSTKVIRSINEDDIGKYVCKAENALGVAETKVELFESIVPVCASSCG